MTTAAVLPKKKCEFWDKCYRKNKQHKEEYLHPGDSDDSKEDKVNKPRLVHDISVGDDDHPTNKTATATNAGGKRKSDQGTSESESDQTASTSDSPPQKKAKVGTSDEEKIMVDYGKKKAAAATSNAKGTTANTAGTSSESDVKTAPNAQQTTQNSPKKDKCKYWNKCYQTNKAHKEDFYHPGEEIPKEIRPKKAPISSHINVNLLLAHKYDEKTTDPRGWWISEKLDGVRAFWNGRCFYSRLGNAFYAPEWFTKDLPKDFHLDGELFGGRGQFQSTVSIVKTAESPKWKDIKYYVFDSPHMGKETFEKRMNTIKEYFEENEPKYAVFVEQTKCKSKEHLEEKLTRVLNIGGEGLMIRKPKSVYEPTRSKTLLKIKKFYDAEAIVIGHERGKGVNQHRCGALRCRMACGKEFSVGSGMTDKNRNNPPKIGSIITYRFQELSNSGSPRFPTFVGIRLDKTEPEDAEIRPVLDEADA